MRDKFRKLEQDFLKSYDDYAAKILRHIYFRVSNKSIAEDLTAETFMKTWDYLRRGNPIKNFKSFLYRVANNLVIDYYRGKAYEPIPVETLEEEAEPAHLGVAALFESKFKLEIIQGHLSLLPKDHQEILVYRFIDELNITEIRELTGKTAANIYVIIHRALKLLRNKVENNERA